MSEIEKAISHYQYGIDHDIFGPKTITFARLSIAALREKMQRGEGCEYCTPPDKMAAIEVHNADGGKTSVICGPNYCPMCGRRLEG
jgi:hypothetical protein